MTGFYPWQGKMPRDNLFKEVTLYVYCTLPIYSACEFRSARITEMCLLQIFRKSEALIHFALLKELYIETKTATRKDPQMILRSLFFIQNLQRFFIAFCDPQFMYIRTSGRVHVINLSNF